MNNTVHDNKNETISVCIQGLFISHQQKLHCKPINTKQNMCCDFLKYFSNFSCTVLAAWCCVSCVVQRIRREFPDTRGEYTGFRPALWLRLQWHPPLLVSRTGHIGHLGQGSSTIHQNMVEGPVTRTQTGGPSAHLYNLYSKVKLWKCHYLNFPYVVAFQLFYLAVVYLE